MNKTEDLETAWLSLYSEAQINNWNKVMDYMRLMEKENNLEIGG